MEKQKEKAPMDVKGIVIDGVEYLNQTQAAEMTGLTLFTFKKKVEEFGIEKIRRASRKILYRKSDIEKAIELGWFKKWFM